MSSSGQSSFPIIRHAAHGDGPDLLRMVALLAEHHGDQPRATLAALERDLFGPVPWAIALVAELDKRLVGYSILLRLYNAQHAERVVDLHHLFVLEDFRRSGVGKLLVKASLNEAALYGCSLLVVGTHPDNSKAQMFYDGLGFTRSQVSGPRFRMNIEQWRDKTINVPA